MLETQDSPHRTAIPRVTFDLKCARTHDGSRGDLSPLAQGGGRLSSLAWKREAGWWIVEKSKVKIPEWLLVRGSRRSSLREPPPCITVALSACAWGWVQAEAEAAGM